MANGLIRSDYTQDVLSLQDEMNRMFGSLFPSSFAAPAARRMVPPMDIEDHGDHYLVTVDVPGMTRDDIDITVENDTLVISGEREQRSEQKGNGGPRRLERAYGRFERVLTLPESIDASQVKASVVDGELCVSVPKPQLEQRQQKVQIGSEPLAESSRHADEVEGNAAAG